MSLSTISTKGQITLPARLRRKLGIKAHDRVRVEFADNAIVIKPVADLFEFEGFLGKALPANVEKRRLREAASARARGAGL